MTPTDLIEILEKHQSWLSNDPRGARANFTLQDLYCSSLKGVRLKGAKMAGTNLANSDLMHADLRECDL